MTRINRSFSGSMDTTIDLGIAGEHDVRIEYTITPGYPGRMYLSNGDPGYPPEPDEVEIDRVIIGWGKDQRDVTWLLADAISENDNIIAEIVENERQFEE